MSSGNALIAKSSILDGFSTHAQLQKAIINYKILKEVLDDNNAWSSSQISQNLRAKFKERADISLNYLTKMELSLKQAGPFRSGVSLKDVRDMKRSVKALRIEVITASQREMVARVQYRSSSPSSSEITLVEKDPTSSPDTADSKPPTEAHTLVVRFQANAEKSELQMEVPRLIPQSEEGTVYNMVDANCSTDDTVSVLAAQ